MAVTSYDRNKNPDEIKRNQEKANNSTSYRCAAIKNQSKFYANEYLKSYLNKMELSVQAPNYCDKA